MGYDRGRRAAEATISPCAQLRFLRRCHSGLTAFPVIDRQTIPASLTIGLVPAANGVVVKVKKIGNGLARLPVIQQQDRIGATRNAMILAMTAPASLKRATL